jgi:hypothetical protein
VTKKLRKLNVNGQKEEDFFPGNKIKIKIKIDDGKFDNIDC